MVQPQPVPIPEEPDELVGIRTVTVLARHADNWSIEVDFPDWVSPYEAYGMLERAAAKLRFEIDELNFDADDDEDEVGH